MSPFEIQAIVILSAYGLMMGWFFYGWLKLPHPEPFPEYPTLKVSVVVAARNEASHLPKLLQALKAQDYPGNLIEVVIVDDHSDDLSLTLLHEACKTFDQLVVVESDAGVYGKKAALLKGAQYCQGELLLLTDADCLPGPGWISSTVSNWITTQADMITGPVQLKPISSVSDHFQAQDFISLTMSGAGACGVGHPFIASGPNLCIRRSTYLQLASSMNTRFASGDDVFMLERIKSLKNARVVFNRDPQSIVTTKPAGGFWAFILQRRRWASKSRAYRNPMMILTPLLVFVANVEMVSAWVALLVNPRFGYLLAILFLIKLVADAPLMLAGYRFFKFKKGIAGLLPVSLVYPIYVVFTALFALGGDQNWKNRRVK